MKKIWVVLLEFTGCFSFLSGIGVSFSFSIFLSALAVFFYNRILKNTWFPSYPSLLNLSLFLRLNYLDFYDLRMRTLYFAIALFFIWVPFKLRLRVKLNFKRAFLVSFCVYLAAAGIFTLRGRYLSGDEPHYLVITQSLWKDGDLLTRDNYEREDYLEFHPLKLDPHIYGRRKLSFHMFGPGIAVLPFYVLATPFSSKLTKVFIYRAGVAFYSALLAAFLFRLLKRYFEEELSSSTWLLIALLPPFLFMSFHLYPEVFGALICVAFFLYLRKPLFAGFLAALLPWFSIKFLALTFLLPVTAFLLEKRKALKTLVFPLLSFFLFEGFLFYHFHSLSPSSFVATDASAFLKIPFSHRIKCLFGYFLDQRDGLLPYAPFYFFPLIFIFPLLKKKRWLWPYFFLFFSYVGFYAITAHRGAYSPYARPIFPLLWVLSFSLAYFLSKKESLSHQIFCFTVATTLFFNVLIFIFPAFLYQPTTLNVRTREGALFSYLSSIPIDLPALLPSFLKGLEDFYLPSLVWIILLVIFGFLLLKFERPVRSHFLLVAFSFAFLMLFFFPLMQFRNPLKVGALEFFSLSRKILIQGEKLIFLRNGTYFINFRSPERPEEVEFKFSVDKGNWRFWLQNKRYLLRKERVHRVKPNCWKWKDFYCRVILRVQRGEGASPMNLVLKRRK